MRRIEILPTGTQQPFSFNFGDSPDECLCRDDELVVDDPYGPSSQPRGRMQLHLDVVLGGQVRRSFALYCRLHKATRTERLSYCLTLSVVVPICSPASGAISLINKQSLELVLRLDCRLYGTVVQKVFPAPVLGIVSVVKVLREYVEQGEMVALLRFKPPLCCISFTLFVCGAHEAVRRCGQHGDYCQNLLSDAELWSGQNHLGKLGVERKYTHGLPEFGHAALSVQCTEV
mmetsp:Transcript_12038/g.36703  ORF Transcript_12038/g.36703 Transcript_12038/m.36703 type:complete len:231 (-) Transcript_12038:1832-2524(-)